MKTLLCSPEKIVAHLAINNFNYLNAQLLSRLDFISFNKFTPES